MTQFNETVKQNFPKLKFFTLAITRAHGKNHAEVFEVRDLFKTMNKKVKQAKKNKPLLDEDFSKLRQVTNNYLVPADGCEAYKATYSMLKEVDEAYHAGN